MRYRQQQNKLSRTLDSSLNNAAAIITKSYLDRLETYDIMRPSEEDIDVDIVMCGKFYKLTRLVLNKEENFFKQTDHDRECSFFHWL